MPRISANTEVFWVGNFMDYLQPPFLFFSCFQNDEDLKSTLEDKLGLK